MFGRFLTATAICALTIPGARSDVIRLKDLGALQGTILAEKTDLIAIDVGYTVLSVPRGEIIAIERGTDLDDTPDQTTGAAGGDQPGADGLYRIAGHEARELPVRDLVLDLGESVVQVKTPGGLGSGFFINEDGSLITNFHVIEGETRISVEVYHQSERGLERRTYKDVRIIALNKFADLALLRIEDEGAPAFEPVPIGDTDRLSVGDRVFAIGSPLGLERTVTEGILSTKTRLIEGALYLQTNAQINPGNSGGPLFNLRGQVVGVTNMKLMFGEGLGFAIPAATVRHFLDHRDAYAYDNDNPSNAYRYLEPPGKTHVTLPAGSGS